MAKLLETLLESISWIVIFAVPAAPLAIAGYLLHHNMSASGGTLLFASLVVVGVILGIILAEKIRKKHGCSTLLFRQFASPDIHS